MFSFQLTPTVKYLLIATVGVHLLGWAVGISLTGYLALFPFSSDYFQPYQVLTSIFAHDGFSHLFHNMIGLFFFGPLIERAIGSQRFLVFYMICGVGSMLLFTGAHALEVYQLEQAQEQYIASPSPEKLHFFITQEVSGGYENYQHSKQLYEFVNTAYVNDPNNASYISQGNELVNQYVERQRQGPPLLGASGAIFGILMGAFLLFPNMKIQLLIPPIPTRIKYLVVVYTAYEIYALMADNPNDNVAHLAHLGGMLFALILIKYWRIPRMM